MLAPADTLLPTRQTKPRRYRLLAILIPFAVWVLLSPGFLFNGDRITPDSASYIEAAHSLTEGRGFQSRPYSGFGSQMWEPIRLWPPGYPLLISATMLTGLKAYDAALVTSVACSGIFVLLVCAFYAQRLPLLVATLSGLVFACMPALLETATMCWSEGPYMLFAILSLICLMRARSNGGMSGAWLFCAGMAGGFSWCIRNVSVALFLASVLYLTGHALRVGVREGMRSAAKWLGGWFLGCSWLIARNLSTFGTVNPYDLPPSALSFTENAATALRVIGMDLTALGRLSYLVTNGYVLWAVCLLLAGVFVLLCRRLVRMPRSDLASLWKEHDANCLLGVFVLVYVLTIVAARTRYQWGEIINFRHFVPIYWILILGIVSIALRSGTRRKAGRLALTIALVIMAILQARSPVNRLTSLVRHGRAPLANTVSRTDAEALGRQVPAGKVVVTDDVTPLRVFGNIDARYMPRQASLVEMSVQAPDQVPVTWPELRQAGDRGLLWGIVVANRDNAAAGDYGPAVKDILESPNQASGFRIVKLGKGVVAAQYIGSCKGCGIP